MKRRTFLAGASAAVASAQNSTVRVGIIGVGGRGTSLMTVLLSMEGVEIPAICDIDQAKVERAQAQVEKSGRPKPEGYSRGEEDFRRLLARSDLDAVLSPRRGTGTPPWPWPR